MTTVYVAVTSRQHEGSDTVGVCSTRERAAAAFRRCVEDGRLRCYHDEHTIETWEIDGSVEARDVYEDEILDALTLVPPPSPRPAPDTEER